MSHGQGSALLVDLGDRSYEIHIGAGLLARAGDFISAAAGSRGFVVTHPVIARLHGETLARGLGAFRAETVLVPVGERQKSVRRAAAVWDELLDRGADRRSVIVAFGGGVIGDLAGFVAATFMRGVPYVQIPTTLLAQVDSSVGGKVGVNHPKAKNLIGAFHQPRLVVADVAVLATLRARDYREGLAEAVKTAAIADADLFDWVERNAAALSCRETGAMSHLVRRCCEIKAEVVRADERESGPRAILNFGHTVGHALESLTDYRSLRHGEAVAIGMVAAARIARLRGILPVECEERLARLLSSLRLPTGIPGTPAEAILGAMRSDKKAVAGVPRFVLPRAIGEMELGVEVPGATLKEGLKEVGASE
ncbi:MAG: 3-dehydroquinate synthase [Armatimonadetes bacterium]|nr:3-dehydroquinate synthase [Armatimonadota bacterium]